MLSMQNKNDSASTINKKGRFSNDAKTNFRNVSSNDNNKWKSSSSTRFKTPHETPSFKNQWKIKRNFKSPLIPRELFSNETPVSSSRWNSTSLHRIDTTLKWFSKLGKPVSTVLKWVPKRTRLRTRPSLVIRGTIEVGVDVVAEINIPDGMLMPDAVEHLEQVEEVVHDIYGHVMEIPLQKLEDIESGQRELEARRLIASGERASFLDHIMALERSNARL
ncbi:hypothetical protein Tco_1410019 [Tanacetum coccineum]